VPDDAVGFADRHLAADLSRRLVLAQTLINYLPQQVVASPGQIFDFGGELRPTRRLYCTHVPGKHRGGRTTLPRYDP